MRLENFSNQELGWIFAGLIAFVCVSLRLCRVPRFAAFGILNLPLFLWLVGAYATDAGAFGHFALAPILGVGLLISVPVSAAVVLLIPNRKRQHDNAA